MKQYKVYGIGAALVDTEIQVSDTDLATMGVEKGVMTLVDEARQAELLQHLQTHLVTASHASGGSAANTIIAAAQFGAPGFMTCKVAGDADGDLYLADLEAAGVKHSLTGSRDTGTTGKCLVLITPDAERSMNSFLGISEQLSTTELDEAAIADSEYLYIEGYQVTSPSGLAAAVRARDVAQSQGVKTALSFSDPGMVEFFRDGMAEIVGDGLDLIFCNEAEALGWAQCESLDEAVVSMKQAARSFAITRGANGALVWDGQTLTEVASEPVSAVDTNGAGDMFAGAFLYAISRGEDYPTAARFANRCAGRIVENYGPRLKGPDYAALRDGFF